MLIFVAATAFVLTILFGFAAACSHIPILHLSVICLLFVFICSVLSQQAFPRWVVTAVDLQMAIQASTVKSLVVQSDIDRPTGLTAIFRLQLAGVIGIGMTALAKIRGPSI